MKHIIPPTPKNHKLKIDEHDLAMAKRAAKVLRSIDVTPMEDEKLPRLTAKEFFKVWEGDLMNDGTGFDFAEAYAREKLREFITAKRSFSLEAFFSELIEKDDLSNEVKRQDDLLRRAANLLRLWTELGGPREAMMDTARWLRDAGMEK